MAFNGNEGAPIDLTEAASWTSNYRSAQPNGIKAHFFGREIIERILAQEDCQGLRIFYGLNDNGEQQLILVGADTNENNQVTGTIADHSVVCPVACGNADALNS
jgi:hypothetical protein